MAEPETLDLAAIAVTATVLVMVQAKLVTAVCPPKSVTLTTTEETPGVVGVPVMTPVEVLMASPVGKPVADQVSVAPDWVSAPALVSVEMAEPVTFDWLDLAVTATVLVIVHEKVALPELAGEALSVAVMVTGVTPGVVGVPVIAPVDASMDRPAGRAEAVQAVTEAPEELVEAAGLNETAPPVTLALEPGLVTVMAPVAFQVKVAEPANAGLALSVAVMVTAHVQEVVGVPVMAPVEALIPSPVGRPDAVHVRVRPLWVSVAVLASEEMAEPTAEDWIPGLVTTTVLVVFQVKVALPWAVEPSVAVRVTEAAPGVVGVPVMAPVVELIVSPAGRPVADQVSVAVGLVSVALGVKVEMADPVTDDLVPGLVTATVLVMVQEKLAEFE